MQAIRKNLERIQHDLERACAKSGRSIDDITILAVSKFQPIERIEEAMDAGLTHFGESRVQEAREKVPRIKRAGLEWHFIGPLQKNKINAALPLFQVFQSVESVELAAEISKRLDPGKTVKVFAQVNISGESQKQGLSPDALPAALQAMAALPGLELTGLMGMAALSADPEDSRPAFALLARLREQVAKRHPGLKLSMGMSGDFVQAVEEGSDLVRLGGALFA